MKRIFQCFTLLFLCFYTSIAQEDLKKHTVSSGETLISIAKKYNVTPFDLQKVNPEVLKGINVNDVLLIPETKINTAVVERTTDSIEASVVPFSVSYTVKPGETKYSIAKRFGLTLAALESQNPQIIEGLKVGDVLEIFPAASNKKSSTSNSSQSSNQNNGPSHDGKRHVVAVGETLVRIAKANGLTVEQLTKANSRVLSKGLIAKQPIWIPGSAQLNAGDNYSHVVKSGDTKFGLSLRFNTTIAELERQNPDIKNMLQIGQTISMSSKENSSQSPLYTPQNEIKTVAKTSPKAEHINNVEDTKNLSTDEKAKKSALPSLHTKTAVTNADKNRETDTIVKDVVKTRKSIATVETEPLKAEEKNIKEKTLVTTSPLEQKEETPKDPVVSTIAEPEFLSYEIQPHDTLYGLAQKANMSTSDFLILNPQLKESVKVGGIIKMPALMRPLNVPSETLSTPVLERDFSIPIDLTTTANTSQLKKLLFFLPFSQEEYQNQQTKSGDFNTVTDDFKRVHLEFYKGANIAIDSLRKMYLSLDVDIITAPSSLGNTKIKPLIEGHEINQYDAIILPFYDALDEEVAAITSDHKIPVITASPGVFRNTTSNLYNALPSRHLQRKKVLEYIKEKDAHIIVLNDVNRTESKTFISEYAPDADFVIIKKNGSFSESELKGKLMKDRLNYVVIDSERTSVFLNTTNVLLSELSNHKIQLAVLEASLIPEEGRVSEKRYRILNMVFPSLIPPKSTPSSKQFLSSYQKEFNLLPSANVMLGFDITFDSLLRLIQQRSFENSAFNDITEYTQLKFNYEKNNLGSFSNEGIYILQYDSNANIREAN